MAKYNETETTTAINLIGAGTEITGDVNSNGDIRIDGTLTGNLKTAGKVVIGETGKINGEIECKNSEVLGEIHGKIKVSELLSLKATSKIFGDIVTKKLAIEPGSRFTGNCKMGEESQNVRTEEPKFGNKEQKSA
ncbi:MAG TPA: cell shape determination protein CcmA [Bacteroidales bacterium]|nr:cell shape determination protein CcmA [Bacteroidales bacterium]